MRHPTYLLYLPTETKAREQERRKSLGLKSAAELRTTILHALRVLTSGQPESLQCHSFQSDCESASMSLYTPPIRQHLACERSGFDVVVDQISLFEMQRN